MRRIFLYIVLILCMIMIVSCATMQSVVGQKKSGLTKTYSITKDEAYVISKKILMEAGASISQDNKEKGEIYAETGFEFGSYGTYIGVWIDSIGEKEVEVTVLTRKALATTIRTGLSQTQFHNEFIKFLE